MKQPKLDWHLSHSRRRAPYQEYSVYHSGRVYADVDLHARCNGEWFVTDDKDIVIFSGKESTLSEAKIAAEQAVGITDDEVFSWTPGVSSDDWAVGGVTGFCLNARNQGSCYWWSVWEENAISAYPILEGWVATLEEAKQAAEDALRKHLESERDRFDKLLRELNGRWKSERFNER